MFSDKKRNFIKYIIFQIEKFDIVTTYISCLKCYIVTYYFLFFKVLHCNVDLFSYYIVIFLFWKCSLWHVIFLYWKCYIVTQHYFIFWKNISIILMLLLTKYLPCLKFYILVDTFIFSKMLHCDTEYTLHHYLVF